MSGSGQTNGVRPAEAQVVVLVVSPRVSAFQTISRALALLGDRDASAVRLHSATHPEAALALAEAEHPAVAFLDVTLSEQAGLGLVHFLQAASPGLVVIAMVPEEPGRGVDLRLAEQAASLGASHVLLGELTGDDILRAFAKVAPVSLQQREATPSALAVARGVGAARTFDELETRLGSLMSSLPIADTRAPLIGELRNALAECMHAERARRAPMQDEATSAYSFAYFVDLAGREIDLARRHGRRFALATVEVEEGGTVDAKAAVELVLAAVRDTDIVARADDRELLILLPETGTKGARTLRRRVLDRAHPYGRPEGGALPLRVGLASFPQDGEDLSRLLRIARRRAERWATVEGPVAAHAALDRATQWLAEADAPEAPPPASMVPLDVPLRDAWSLFDFLVREATRGGDTLIGLHAPIESEAPLGLSQAIRAATVEAFGPLSGGIPSGGRVAIDAKASIVVVSGTSRLADSVSFGGLEIVGILSEHASYGLVGRIVDGHLRALQTHDLPLVEALVQGLEQPILRRGSLQSSASPGALGSAAPVSNPRRSDPYSFR